jgi:hypothetical protein
VPEALRGNPYIRAAYAEARATRYWNACRILAADRRGGVILKLLPTFLHTVFTQPALRLHLSRLTVVTG